MSTSVSVGRVSGSLFVLIALGWPACSSGSSGIAASDGGADGRLADGDPAGSGDGGGCAEFQKGGGTIGPSIGGSAPTQVAVQSVADIAQASQTQVNDLVAACKDLAVALGASSAQQSAADDATTASARATAWCALGASRIGAIKAKASGTLSVSVSSVSCKLAVATKAACQGRCSESGPCAAAANPFICTGGKLAGGFCEGGQLEGGCNVDAKCDASCDVSVAAVAQCAEPTVTVVVNGAADAAAASKLKSALEANLPTIFALRAHFAAETKVAGGLTASASAVSGIKAACIPPVISAAATAVDDIGAGSAACGSVLATVQ